MSGIFNTLNTANKGLLASQTALHTASHNISNANTKGYSRQRVELKADLAFTFGGIGQLGTGVKMSSIIRVADDFVTKQIRKENGTLQKFTVKSEVMEQLEIILNEPSDTSLNFNLGEMFDSWQELSKNPESLNSKTIVVEKSKTLADTINHISDQINGLKDDTVNLIKNSAVDFNSTLSKLDTLNAQIANIAIKDQVPNDLLDQRDLLLNDLSSVTDFSADFDQYGRVSVSLDSKDAADNSTKTEVLGFEGIKYKMEADGTGKVTLKPEDTSLDTLNLNSKTGTIVGYKEALNEIDKQNTSLDKFTKTMATAINKVHGTDIFVDINSSGTIKVDQAIIDDSSKVNAGLDFTNPAAPEGDGSRALAIARLRNTKLDFSDSAPALEFTAGTLNLKDQVGGVTIEGAYKDIVTMVGISKQHADNTVDNQEVLLDQLILRRESTSGVSIDEEVKDVIKFQKAYEANAKVISVLAEMLDVLINRTGV